MASCLDLDKEDLHNACAVGNYKTVHLLLKSGADVNVRNRDYATPIITAARSERVMVCEILIDPGAQVNAQDKEGMSALHEAAKNGSVQICKFVMAKDGAEVDIRTNQSWTPLHFAVTEGHLEAVKFLLDKGADVTSKNGSGKNAGGLAILHDRDTVLDYLMEWKPKDQKDTAVTAEAVQHPRSPADDEAYRMQSTPKGYALVINNIKYDDDHFTYRHGADIDGRNITALLQSLDYEVQYHPDCTKREMRLKIWDFSQMDDHAKVDSAIIVIMGHGDKDVFYSRDGLQVDESWIVWSFNNEQCPHLRGKPKVFFFEACRGSKIDHGVFPLEEATDSGVVGTTPSHVDLDYLILSDIYLACSTVPGCVSIRNPRDGCFFTQAVCSVFKELAHKEDIETMLKKVMQRVAAKSTTLGHRQTVACHSYGFMYRFYFNYSSQQHKE